MMNREELERSFEKVQIAKNHFVEYMRDNDFTPSEGMTAITGLLMHMYDALTERPSVEGFTEMFSNIYALHFKLQHTPDSNDTIQ